MEIVIEGPEGTTVTLTTRGSIWWKPRKEQELTFNGNTPVIHKTYGWLFFKAGLGLPVKTPNAVPVKE